MRSTILQTVRHLYAKIDNLIKLLDNQQNVFEINKKKQIIKLISASPLLKAQLASASTASRSKHAIVSLRLVLLLVHLSTSLLKFCFSETFENHLFFYLKKKW